MPRTKSIGVTLASNGDYWQAVWYTTDGRRKARSLGAKADLSRSRARRRCDELAREMAINPGARDKRRSPTLQEWLDEHEQLCSSSSAEGTLQVLAATKKHLLAYFKPAMRIDRITRLDAERWRAGLYKSGLGESTVRKHTRTVKGTFNRAVDADLIQVNPFGRLKGSVVSLSETLVKIADADVMTLIDTATGHWKLLIALCALAGLRRGEALRIEWSSIQWDRGRLIVEHDGHNTTKARRREVRLEPELEKILLHNHDCATTNLIVPLSGNNVERTIRKIIKDAGLKAWPKPLHSLRKWRATTWRNTYPEHVVDAWLGHSLAVARQHYASVPESCYESGRSATNAPQNQTA